MLRRSSFCRCLRNEIIAVFVVSGYKINLKGVNLMVRYINPGYEGFRTISKKIMLTKQLS